MTMKKKRMGCLILSLLFLAEVYSVDHPNVLELLWQGDVGKFKEKEPGEWWLSAERAAGTASLFANSGKSLNTLWEFHVQMEFTPSANNNARVYLCADTARAGKLWGLCLRIGDDKRMALWHEPASGRGKSLLKGLEKRLDVDRVSLSVRATLDWNGDFCLYSRLNEETDYVQEGSAHLEAISADRFFGLLCAYTTTRHEDAFAFSDFYIADLSSLPPPEPKPGAGENLPESKESVFVAEPYSTPGLDHFQLHYAFPNEGVRCNLLVFDMQGRVVAQPVNNFSLEPEGAIDWYPDTHLAAGVYLLYMEVYDQEGRVKRYKFPVVVKR